MVAAVRALRALPAFSAGSSSAKEIMDEIERSKNFKAQTKTKAKAKGRGKGAVKEAGIAIVDPPAPGAPSGRSE